MKNSTRKAIKSMLYLLCLLLSANAFAVVVTLDIDESTDPPTLFVSNNTAQ